MGTDIEAESVLCVTLLPRLERGEFLEETWGSLVIFLIFLSTEDGWTESSYAFVDYAVHSAFYNGTQNVLECACQLCNTGDEVAF